MESRSPAPFPAATAWSIVLGARDGNSPDRARCLEALVRNYWKPVWWYLVRRWALSHDDAADLAQEFFARLSSEAAALKNVSPERGRFRTFLKLELRNLVVDSLRHRHAQKRGGDARVVPIDPRASVEWPGLTPDEEFDRMWAASLLSTAVERLGEKLKAEGREPIYRAYWNCAVADSPISYKSCAEELGVKVNDVCNYLYRARTELRRIVIDLVRESVEREEEVEDELNNVLRLLAQE